MLANGWRYMKYVRRRGPYELAYSNLHCVADFY